MEPMDRNIPSRGLWPMARRVVWGLFCVAKFADGFRSSAMISSLVYLNVLMRNEMIRQSKIDPKNDGTGFSAGMNGDMFKLAGGRWFYGSVPDQCSPLGCWQNGPGSVFGSSYAKGGLTDMVTESFAGPHDFANSFTWYDQIGDAISYSPAKSMLLELTTNYTTSLMFAAPFATAAILEQSGAAASFSTLKKEGR